VSEEIKVKSEEWKKVKSEEWKKKVKKFK